MQLGMVGLGRMGQNMVWRLAKAGHEVVVTDVDAEVIRKTVAIEYEAYGPMAEAEMGRIAEALVRDFPTARVSMMHRVGRLSVGEPSVAIVAVAPHRAEAFAACRAAIDRVKATVPIWKKEFHPDGSSDWVDPTALGL